MTLSDVHLGLLLLLAQGTKKFLLLNSQEKLKMKGGIDNIDPDDNTVRENIHHLLFVYL